MYLLRVKVHKVRMVKICQYRKSVVYANGINQRSWWNVCPCFSQSGLSVLYAPIGSTLFGPRREKTCLRRIANYKVVDQPAHPRSLASACFIRFLESTISKLATNESSFF